MNVQDDRRCRYRREADRERDVAYMILERRLDKMQHDINALSRRLTDDEKRLIAKVHDEADEFRRIMNEEIASKTDWKRWRLQQFRRALSGLIFFAGGFALSLFALGLYEWTKRNMPQILDMDNASTGGVAGIIAAHQVSTFKRHFARHWRRAPHAAWLVLTGAASGLVMSWYGANTFFPPLEVYGRPVPMHIAADAGSKVEIRYFARKLRNVSGLVGRSLDCVTSGHHEMPSFPAFMMPGQIDVTHTFVLPDAVQANDTCHYDLWVEYQNDILDGWIVNPVPLRIEMETVTINVMPPGQEYPESHLSTQKTHD